MFTIPSCVAVAVTATMSGTGKSNTALLWQAFETRDTHRRIGCRGLGLRDFFSGHADGLAPPHSNSFISASACSSQKRISISRYIVIAVVRCSRACSRLPVSR